MVALVPLQTTPWLPVWVTPLWILGIGVLVGLLVAAVLLAVLAALSRVPGLGTLPDRPRVANVVAGLLTLVIAAGMLFLYLPETTPDYRILLIIPVLAMSAIVGWGLVYGMWRRTINELWSVLTEGVMGYALGTAAVVMVVGLALTPLAEDTRPMLESLTQVNWVGSGERVQPVHLPAVSSDITDPDDAPFRQVFVEYDPRAMTDLTIESNRTIILADAESPEDFQFRPTRIDPDSPFTWRRGELGAAPLPVDSSEGIWIQNREIDPATVNFRIVSLPPVQQVSTVVITAISVVLSILAYLAFRQAAPRVAAIALATSKSEMAQPLYVVLLAIGAVAMILFLIVPFNTLGEDIKLLKDSGMTLIMVLGLIQAVWSAGTSVSDEIEGKTALTVLSKPVSRRSFLLGKYTGIMMAVFVLFVVLGLLLMVVTAYKPIFDARENSQETPMWQEAHGEMVSVVPGIALYFMETMAIGAIGVAIATRLPMLANFVICFIVYVVGNLTAPLVRSSEGSNELVGFVGKLIAVVIPNLNAFNIQSAVDAGNPIPPIYLAGAFNYLVCFGIMALMVALLLFEDRDLA